MAIHRHWLDRPAHPGWLWSPWYLAVVWLPLAIWVVAFFRDPERHGPRGDQ